MFIKSQKRQYGKRNDNQRGKGRGMGRGAGRGGSRGPGGRRFFRKKTCRFCSDRVVFIDYKNYDRLVRFLTEKGKIIPRRTTGNCAKHQRILTRSIKKARHAAILAFQTG